MVRTPYSSLSSRLKWPKTRYSTLATISSSEMSPFSWAMLSLLSSLHNLGDKDERLRLVSGGMRQGAGRVHLQSNMPLISSSCQVSGMLTGDGASGRGLCLLPFTSVCNVAFVYAHLHATGLVAVLVGQPPVARPRLLTNAA